MGYLELASIPDFTKVVISLWFRIPAASIVDGGGYLMTFGAPQPITHTDLNTTAYPDQGVVVLDSVGSTVTDGYTAPCHISYVNAGDGRFKLKFNFQLAELAAESKVSFFASTFALDTIDPDTLAFVHADQFGGYGFSGPIGVQNTGWNFGGFHADIVDASPLVPLTSPPLLEVDSPIHLTTDKWHHLLLSIDLSDGIHCHGSPTPDNFATLADGYDTYWKVWYAIDDTNYNGEGNLGPNFVTGSSDLNAVGDDEANSVASFHTSIPLYNNDVPGPPTFVSTGAIPAGGNAMGFPADARFVSGINVVEMAELQVYTGVSLDTSVPDNRRLFVTDLGKPESVDIARAALLIDPVVALSGFANWIAGMNTGTAGLLDPTGTITKYTPGPSLG